MEDAGRRYLSGPSLEGEKVVEHVGLREEKEEEDEWLKYVYNFFNKIKIVAAFRVY